MTCPICEQKPMNCDCTDHEISMNDRIDELEEENAALLEEVKSLKHCLHIEREGKVEWQCAFDQIKQIAGQRKPEGAHSGLLPDSMCQLMKENQA